MTAADRLSDLLQSASLRLERISEEDASQAPAGRWSKKQVIGHLIDSAGNNHQRLVRAQLAPSLDFPNYQQEEWVRVQSYATESWRDLANLWVLFNRHLVHLIRAVPEERLARPCVIGGREAIPLSAVIQGYLEHLEHHLSQILEAQ